MPEYKLPDVGEGLTEAEIVTWRVAVGDTVAVNDVIVEIETAKSIVELPSPYAGEITAILVEEGETVAVGTPIVAIGEAASKGEPETAPQPDESEASPQLEAKPDEPVTEARAQTRLETPGADEPIDTNVPPEGTPTLVGYGPRETTRSRRPRAGASESATSSSSSPERGTSGGRIETPEPNGVLAKPPTRKLAKDLGVDLADVTPSGEGGVVTREDVEAAADRSLSLSKRAGVSTSSTTDAERREPIKGVRKQMAAAMVSSAFTAPHVTEWVTVDATATVELVERLQSRREFRDLKVSPLLVVARAVALALRRTPIVNSTWDEDAQEVVIKPYLNLGIAAATPRGLLVPNIKGAERMGLPELAREINDLTTTAREGRTQPADYSQGTFTITNVGVFGVDGGTPIINPGESAILCLGQIAKQPWVSTNSTTGEDEVVPRQVVTLSLSFDHRHVDGAAGSQFLADVAGIVADPATAMLF